MLYEIHDTIANLYCAFDPELDKVSRWKRNYLDVDLNDGYSISGAWSGIHGLSHGEILEYLSNTNGRLVIINNPKDTYEYW